MSLASISLLKPPWLKICTTSGDLTDEVHLESKRWFSASMDDTSSTVGFVNSAKMTQIKEVEEHIQKLFPKCQPMFVELIEFLAQCMCDKVLHPNFHLENLLANKWQLPLPFLIF